MNSRNQNDLKLKRASNCDIQLVALLLFFAVLLSACTINIHLPSRYVPPPSNYSNQISDNILQIRTTSAGIEKSTLTSGEPFELEVQASVEAFVHCYYKQADGDILRLFPNPFATQSLVDANESLVIPNSDRFQLIASRGKQRESVMCLAAHENLENKIPTALKKPGFSALAIKSFDELYVIYRGLTTSPLIGRVQVIDVD